MNKITVCTPGITSIGTVVCPAPPRHLCEFDRRDPLPKYPFGIKPLHPELEGRGVSSMYMEDHGLWLHAQQISNVDGLSGVDIFEFISNHGMLEAFLGWRECDRLLQLGLPAFRQIFAISDELRRSKLGRKSESAVIFWKTVGLDEQGNLAVLGLADGGTRLSVAMHLLAVNFCQAHGALVYPGAELPTRDEVPVQ